MSIQIVLTFFLPVKYPDEAILTRYCNQAWVWRPCAANL